MPCPVNHLNRVERRTAHAKAATDFARRLAELQPLAVACVIKSIEPHVKQSLALMKLGSIPMVVLSFPAMGHQRAYVSGLAAFLTELARCGVLLGPGRVT